MAAATRSCSLPEHTTQDFAADWDWPAPKDGGKLERCCRRATPPPALPVACNDHAPEDESSDDGDFYTDSASDSEFEDEARRRGVIVNPTDDDEGPWKASNPLPRRFPHYNGSPAALSSASPSALAPPGPACLPTATPAPPIAARHQAAAPIGINKLNKHVAEEIRTRKHHLRIMTYERRCMWRDTRRFCEFHGITVGEWEGGDISDWEKWGGGDVNGEVIDSEEAVENQQEMVAETGHKRQRTLEPWLRECDEAEFPKGECMPALAWEDVQQNQRRAEEAGVRWGEDDTDEELGSDGDENKSKTRDSGDTPASRCCSIHRNLQHARSSMI